MLQINDSITATIYLQIQYRNYAFSFMRSRDYSALKYSRKFGKTTYCSLNRNTGTIKDISQKGNDRLFSKYDIPVNFYCHE